MPPPRLCSSCKSFFFILGGGLFMLLESSQLAGQANLGRILGTVRDSSGASIPDVEVILTDVDRGLERTVTTDSAGEYNAPSLNPGKKIVRAQHMGFRTFEQKNITLEVGQDAHIDIVLSVGDVNDTITVTETPLLLDTTGSTLGGTLSNQAI